MKNHAFIAFLGGAALGAVAALLLAPEKGSDTRRKIKKTYKKEKERLLDLIEEICEEVPEAAEKLKDLVCKKTKEEKPLPMQEPIV